MSLFLCNVNVLIYCKATYWSVNMMFVSDVWTVKERELNSWQMKDKFLFLKASKHCGGHKVDYSAALSAAV
jgi:hypothetical protein